MSYDIETSEIEKAENLCQKLMATKHYAKMGSDGIFAVIAKARSMNISPLEALNGGMYSVQGKVEMSGVMMISLIRQAGHSIKLDKLSNRTSVTLHGKRKDNGDEWTASFSIDDAKTAGIYKSTWEKYPQAMCIWRCVSMLGRYLFADVIKGCYVQGEISSLEPSIDDLMISMPVAEIEKPPTISEEQSIEIKEVFSKCSDEYKKRAWNSWRTLYSIKAIEDLPVDHFDSIMQGALTHLTILASERQKALLTAMEGEEQVA